jgi:hypothetical protein
VWKQEKGGRSDMPVCGPQVKPPKKGTELTNLDGFQLFNGISTNYTSSDRWTQIGGGVSAH